MLYYLLKRGAIKHRHHKKQSSGPLTEGAQLVGPLVAHTHQVGMVVPGAL